MDFQLYENRYKTNGPIQLGTLILSNHPFLKMSEKLIPNIFLNLCIFENENCLSDVPDSGIFNKNRAQRSSKTSCGIGFPLNLIVLSGHGELADSLASWSFLSGVA